VPAPVRRSLTALALVLPLLLPATNAGSAVRVPGIDVSKWQDAIDWEQAADFGIRFVVIRSTKGGAYVDPWFATNEAGADANGVVVGAYHRATPSDAPNDAFKEANHYLEVARNAPGDVIPALDIEETGGLDDPALIAWVRTWVMRVHDRLGVKPMIYTSPNFWRTNMGDTTWFAEHGYPLWIANWDVPFPQQIAENWAGHGWTYWQWDVTGPGSVPGVSTDIDRDRFAGTDLTDGTIASLTVTPATGGTIAGPRIACGGTQTRCERLSNPNELVELTATPDPDSGFLGWTGACASAGTAPTCAITLRDAVEVSADFVPAVTLGEDAEGSAFAWGEVPGVHSLGGSARVEDRAGASMTFAFTGGRLQLRTLTGPAIGRARIGVDGAKIAVLDGWAREQGVRSDLFKHLGGGPHILRIGVLGSARDRSLGTRVGLDALRWEGELRDDPEPLDATLGPDADAAYSDAHAVRSHITGSSAALTFTGTGITFVTATGPDMGRAEVWIDGEQVAVAGLYSEARVTGVGFTYLGLTDEEHRIRVVVQGRKNTASTGTDVVVDGWVVR
jgi:GH25 family lysozyme M1 (1,4-beta-N-acetylmuramidase)